MEVINAKKGRTPLQYRPRGVDEDEISDDEYYVMNGNEEDFVNQTKLEKVYGGLVEGNRVKGMSLDKSEKNKLVVVGGVTGLLPSEIEDEYKREDAICSLVNENFKKIEKTLKEFGCSIGRSETKDHQLFKPSIKKPPKKIPQKKEKPQTRFEDNFDFDLPEKPEKVHKTFSEFQKQKSESSKFKNRPGKRSRERYRTSKIPR